MWRLLAKMCLASLLHSRELLVRVTARKSPFSSTPVFRRAAFSETLIPCVRVSYPWEDEAPTSMPLTGIPPYVTGFVNQKKIMLELQSLGGKVIDGVGGFWTSNDLAVANSLERRFGMKLSALFTSNLRHFYSMTDTPSCTHDSLNQVGTQARARTTPSGRLGGGGGRPRGQCCEKG